MVGKKWQETAQTINALGGGAKLEEEKVEKKWFDLKLTIKKD